MRIGILGLGYMGVIRRRELEARDDCEVTRIFHTESGSIPAPLRGSSWRELVADSSLDAVFVCLPTDLTCEVVCAALGQGLHVFAEKPPGQSVAELERMAQSAEAAGRVLQFGFNHRRHPAFVELQRRRADLGELVWMRGRYGKPKDTTFEDGWRADAGRAAGGILLDQGIHLLDLMRALCPELRVDSAVAVGGSIEDELMALLRAPEGAVASLHSSHSQWPPMFSLELGLTEGSMVMDGLLTRTGRYGPERLRWRHHPTEVSGERTYAHDDSWALEIDAFVRSVRDGAPVDVGSTGEALSLMRLVDAIYAAARR